MTGRVHIFCVPFPGAGHAINMLNVAFALASLSIKVHVLVLSQSEAKKWLAATGQAANSHMSLEVLNDGQWEDWRGRTAGEAFGMIQSPEFRAAVDKAVAETETAFPVDRIVAMVLNPLMSGLPPVARKHNLKTYALLPVPYNTFRLGISAGAEAQLTDTRAFKGIGGSSLPLELELGDAIDYTSFSKMRDMSTPVIGDADGLIYCGTNIGLEGDEYKQPHLPGDTDGKPEYLIGPMLGQWFEDATGNAQLRDEHLAQAAQADPCIQFLNKQEKNSVVYIALGSHIELEIEQAEMMVDNLRKHNTPWVLLFRNETEQMRDRLGGAAIKDGVVTPWAPQLEILLHPAVKCVISHGGFGTMIEGVYAGQAFITSPVASDQFVDTKVMLHLGIALGTIAENPHCSVMSMSKLTPTWPDDGGQKLRQLFARVFGSTEGEAELRAAREASLALKKRMQKAKRTDAAAQLQKLQKDLISDYGRY